MRAGRLDVNAFRLRGQRSRSDVLDPMAINHWISVQRMVFLWLGPVGALACVTALATQWSAVDRLDLVALPLLAAILLTTTGALAFGRLKVIVATRISFLATTLYFLAGLDRQFFWFVPHYQMLSESSYWFAVLYATAFIAFRARRATHVSSAIFAVSLLICSFHLILLKSGGLLTYRTVASVAQFLISSAVLVVAQFAVGRLRHQLDQVRNAAYIDVLTGLPNRRYAEQQLDTLVQAGRGFSMVMLDIDHFKQVNDTYGHQAGDLVLRETGRVIGKHLHGQQFMARWGGEEFVLVLPGLPKRGGKALAEAARQDLYQHVFDQVGGLTASFGVAEWVTGDDLVSVMRRADAALYAAKRQGRNGVRVAMEDGRLTRLDLPEQAAATEPDEAAQDLAMSAAVADSPSAARSSSPLPSD
jgi:diguanylate cyclase (GGDEF)-like protein